MENTKEISLSSSSHGLAKYANYSPEQVALVKSVIASDLTDNELGLYMFKCKSLNVDPLARQVYAIKRGGRLTFQTSIDFLRLAASRSKEYAGSDDPVFEGEPKSNSFLARVTVYRMVKGQKCSFSATARWPEYKPPTGQDQMWVKMPFGQLGKCAEALALRKAFPAETSQVYIKEEMDQAGPPDAPAAKQDAPGRVLEAEVVSRPTEPAKPLLVSDKQVQRIWIKIREAGIPEAAYKSWLERTYGVTSTKLLPSNAETHVEAWIRSLKELPTEHQAAKQNGYEPGADEDPVYGQMGKEHDA